MRDNPERDVAYHLVCGVNHQGIQRNGKDLDYDKADSVALAIEASERL